MSYKCEIQNTRKWLIKMRWYLNKIKSLAQNLQLAGCNYSNLDLFTWILPGLDSNYTPIVIQLNDKDISWVKFQTTLLTYKNKHDQLNSFQNLNINYTNINAKFTATNTNAANRSGNTNGRGLNKGGRARGRWRNSNGRPICQIYGKLGHSVAVCYTDLI